MNLSKLPLRHVFLHPERLTPLGCLFSLQPFITTTRRYSDKPSPSAPQPVPSAADLPSPLADAPRATGKAVEEFTPKPLPRPIGLAKPPLAGQNSGVDSRSWKERRDDFVNYDKHLVKRKMLCVSPVTSSTSSRSPSPLLPPTRVVTTHASKDQL